MSFASMSEHQFTSRCVRRPSSCQAVLKAEGHEAPCIKGFHDLSQTEHPSVCLASHRPPLSHPELPKRKLSTRDGAPEGS